jgi:cobalt-zinc-cadmium efflux system membrane fusion protein
MWPSRQRSGFAQARTDHADRALSSSPVLGLGMFRSIRGAFWVGSLAVLAAIAPASAQNPVKDGQRLTVSEGSPLRSEIRTAPVTAKEIERTLELPARVEADPTRTVKVLPPAPGRIIDVKVQPGDRVGRQQELAVIYASQLRRSSLDTPEPRRSFGFAGAATAARSGLTGIGKLAVLDETAVAELDQSVELRAPGVPVEENQGTRLLSLRAPVAGSVLDLQIAAGATVRFSDSMMTIANLNVIWVTTNVPQKETALFITGQPVRIRLPAYPGEDFMGEARVIGSAFDAAPDRKVRIAVANPNNRLKPNMRASAIFFGPKETVPMVPISALVLNRTMAFVEIEPWIFEARAVGLGRLEGSEAVVASGLQIGDRVVAAGAARLVERQAQ